jgi:preprotein translocase subunit YajC
VLISEAFAQSANAATSSGGFDPSIIMMVAIFGVFYFLLIRPQQKRAKETKSMIDAIKAGDEVVLGGGLLGKVVKVGDTYLTLDIGEGRGQSIEVLVQRTAIQTLLPKGTIKSV